MPGYDPDKDKKLKEWKNEETGLIISIHQYGDGEPKVQLGPRVLKKKDGTDRAPSKALLISGTSSAVDDCTVAGAAPCGTIRTNAPTYCVRRPSTTDRLVE